MAQNRETEAQGAVVQLVAREPNNFSFLNAASMISLMTRDFQSAKQYSSMLIAVAPGNIGAHSYLLICEQALQNAEGIQAQLSKIREIWEASPSLKASVRSFNREHFDVAENKVIASQFFELQGKFAARYHFRVFRPGASPPTIIYSFGSYPFTNTVAREAGTLGANERLWHLDRYENSKHMLIGFHKHELGYEEVKKLVTAQILKLDTETK